MAAAALVSVQQEQADQAQVAQDRAAIQAQAAQDALAAQEQTGAEPGEDPGDPRLRIGSTQDGQDVYLDPQSLEQQDAAGAQAAELVAVTSLLFSALLHRPPHRARRTTGGTSGQNLRTFAGFGFLIVSMSSAGGAFPFPVCVGVQYATTNPGLPKLVQGSQGTFQVAMNDVPGESLGWTSQALPGPASPAALIFAEWSLPLLGTPQAPPVPPAPGTYTVPLPGYLVVSYANFGPGSLVVDIFSMTTNPGLPPLPALPTTAGGSFQVQIVPQYAGGGGGGGGGGRSRGDSGSDDSVQGAVEGALLGMLAGAAAQSGNES